MDFVSGRLLRIIVYQQRAVPFSEPADIIPQAGGKKNAVFYILKSHGRALSVLAGMGSGVRAEKFLFSPKRLLPASVLGII